MTLPILSRFKKPVDCMKMKIKIMTLRSDHFYKRFQLFLMLLFGVELAAQALGGAPTAENLELTTRRNMPVGGQLIARAGEGDRLTYAITTRPVKGELRLLENGRFVYTPRQNKKGRDYFGYRAIDSEGQVSQEATAIIRIE